MHLLIDLVENTVLVKIPADQHHFTKPGRGREVGLRSRLDFYRTIGDTCHTYLLVENGCVLSLQGGIFLRRLATGHTSLRIAWDLRRTLRPLRQEIGDIDTLIAATALEEDLGTSEN